MLFDYLLRDFLLRDYLLRDYLLFNYLLRDYFLWCEMAILWRHSTNDPIRNLPACAALYTHAVLLYTLQTKGSIHARCGSPLPSTGRARGCRTLDPYALSCRTTGCYHGCYALGYRTTGCCALSARAYCCHQLAVPLGIMPCVTLPVVAIN